jgi:hypothetical protein
MKIRITPIVLSGLLLGLSGCATYTETTKDAVAARRSGNTQSAAFEAESLAQKHRDDNDTIIYHLEAASAYRALGLNQIPPPAPSRTAATAMGTAAPTAVAAAPNAESEDWKLAPYKKSLRFFSIADDKIDEWEEKAKHSVSAGATMVVTNPQMTPYRGQAYDKVMASTYCALNYLAVGEPEKARASFNKAYNRQADAISENQKRIEKEQEKIAAAKSGRLKSDDGKTAKSAVDVSKSQGDLKSKAALDDINAQLDTRIKAYGDYVNPFTVFADALFMTACSTDRQEQERGAKQFLRVAAMVPDNEYLRQDAAMAEEIAAGRAKMTRTTYVIFESGEAPHREEMLIPVPIFLLQKPGQPPIYTQLPLYRLAFNDRFNPSATITAGGRQFATATVCNMDSVVARDYKNNLSSMWLDAFLCASTKALINYEINEQAKKNGGTAGLVFGLVSSVVNMATTRADTRTWSSLPKTFSYARLETPADGTLVISTADNVSKTITVPEGTVSVVYVKQIQPGQPLLVDAFKLL